MQPFLELIGSMERQRMSSFTLRCRNEIICIFTIMDGSWSDCESRVKSFGQEENTLQASWPDGVISCWWNHFSPVPKVMLSGMAISQLTRIWQGTMVKLLERKAVPTCRASQTVSFERSLFGNPRCTLSLWHRNKTCCSLNRTLCWVPSAHQSLLCCSFFLPKLFQ